MNNSDNDNLHLKDQCWHNTFDAIPDLVAVIDRDFRIVKVNRAMAGFLKQPPDALTGSYCYKVMHGRNSPWINCPHEKMLEVHEAVTSEVDDTFTGRTFLITASPIFDEHGDIAGSVHIARDISEIKAVNNDLSMRNKQIEGLNRLSKSATVNPSINSVAGAALREIQSIIEPDLSLFYLISGDELILHAQHPESEEHVRERKQMGQCLCGMAARDGQPVYARDIHKDSRCTLDECKEAGVRSFSAIPLKYEDRMIGVLGLASKTERDFSSEHQFLETLASTVSTITWNAILFEQLQDQSQTLDDEVKKRTMELEARNAELERLNKLFVDREFRVKELKDRIKELEGK